MRGMGMVGPFLVLGAWFMAAMQPSVSASIRPDREIRNPVTIESRQGHDRCSSTVQPE
jgi:hypothetical protein